MPFPFQAILVAGATGYLLTGILFLLVRAMPRTEPGAGWWALSSLAGGVGYLSLLVLALQGDPARGEAVYNLLFVAFAFGLYAGGRRFLGLGVPLKILGPLSSAVVLWLLYFDFYAPQFLPAAVAIALYCGVLNLHLAWLWYQHRRVKSGLSVALIALLAIAGLHWLDYPVLRPVEWFAPIGFSLCAITASLMNGLFAAVLLRQFRMRMESAEQTALSLAHRDPLTGLNNRLALDALFEQALAQSHRSGKRLALLFMDLDNFKTVNDSFGHDVGDQVLKAVAARLKSSFRETDIVARIGGDEFVVILSDVFMHDKGLKDVEHMAEKALEHIRDPIQVNGTAYTIYGSIGISFTPVHGETLNHVMLAADKAMYEAKNKTDRAREGAYVFAGL